MADSRPIHEFVTGTADNGSLFLVDTPDVSAQSGYTTEKLPMTDVGTKIVNGIQYTQALNTTAKTIVGAINELEAGGGGGGYPVLYGTANPTSAQGSDGQLYGKYKHSPACFLEVSVYKPIDSTTVSITVTENGTTVYTATPSCTIYGEYSEVTSTVTTSIGTYIIKHHGEQHNEAYVPSQFIEIDGSEVTFTADGQNSSFPIDETKDLAIGYASYVPSCTVSVSIYKPLDSTTVSITITENGNTIYTATPSCTIFGEYSEVTSTITTSTGTHTIRHWGVHTSHDVPSQFIKIDGDTINFTAVGDNSSFPIDETKSLTVEGGNVVTDMWLKQSSLWLPIKMDDGESGVSEIHDMAYTGNGNTSHDITFPTKPQMILAWDGLGLSNYYALLSSFRYGSTFTPITYYDGSTGGILYDNLSYSVDELTLTISGVDAGAAMNASGNTYHLLWV